MGAFEEISRGFKVSEGEIFENLVLPREEEEELEEDSFGDTVNWDIVVGMCANCGDLIHHGEGGPTVHDYCENEFIWFLNEELAKIYRDQEDVL